MKIPSIVLCLLGLAFVCSAQSFVGTWSDSEYGGNIYVCVSNSTLYMSFSEVGIGIGTITGSTVSGRIYVGGGDTLDHETTGTFEWTLNNSGSAFTGTWSWDGDSNDNDWSGDLASSSTPTIRQCAFLASSGSIEGSWSSNSNGLSVSAWDICVSSSEYTSSYDISGGNNGYDEGVTHRSGLIGSGYFNEDTDNDARGVSLTFLLSDGTLGNFVWLTAPGEDLDSDNYGDSSEQNYYFFTKDSANPSDSDCSRNEDMDGNDGNNNNDSAANIIAAGSGLLLALLMVMF